MKFSNLKVGATLRHKESGHLISVVSIDEQSQSFLGSDGQHHAAELFKRTPAAKLGYVVGDEFWGNAPRGFSDSVLITLSQDNGSDMPIFKARATGEVFYRTLHKVKPITPPNKTGEQ